LPCFPYFRRPYSQTQSPLLLFLYALPSYLKVVTGFITLGYGSVNLNIFIQPSA
jgi:hypothetical protein